MSPRLKTYALAGILVVGVQVGASLLLGRGFHLTALGDLIQTLCLLAGLSFAVPNIRATHGRERAFWVFVSFGFGLWLAFQLLWDYFEIFRRQEVPDPFVGDIVLFLHIVPMMAALSVRPHAHETEQETHLGSLDFLLLATWWVYLYLFTVIPWQYIFRNESLYDRSLNILYLTEKIVFLVWLGVLWLQSRSAWKTFYGQWFVATVLYATSSYIANVAIERHHYYTGSFYDVPLVASLVWLGALGLLNPKRTAARKPKSTRIEALNIWTTRLAMLATISLPVLMTWSVFGAYAPVTVRAYRIWLTAGAMVVMGLLVYLKQHLLDRELLRSLRTSRESLATVERVQVQLIQSDKLASLGQLVAGATHELNNPLTAVIGYSQLLAESNPLTPYQQSLAEKLGRHANRMKTLVSDLLSFAKQVPLARKELTLDSVIQTAVKLCTSHPVARGIRVELSLDPNLPTICGDSNQLLQVFVHILRNGIEALEGTSDGTIRIVSQKCNESVVVEFLDNGPGIEEPDLVFDPFYTTKPVGKGAGLGLSACYGILQEHQGRIVCENRPEGGAIFRIELPVARSFSEVAH
jgi:signal transduction histidine kinase